jgi:hypothetical protein
MTATLNVLKGQLSKLNLKLSAIASKGKKKGNNKAKKKKNKKNTHNQHEQKKDEVWKKELPKDSDKQKKGLKVHLPLGVVHAYMDQKVTR